MLFINSEVRTTINMCYTRMLRGVQAPRRRSRAEMQRNWDQIMAKRGLDSAVTHSLTPETIYNKIYVIEVINNHTNCLLYN